jgi:hypothetical protein
MQMAFATNGLQVRALDAFFILVFIGQSGILFEVHQL